MTRSKLLLALGVFAGLLLVRNLYTILLGLPDEASQGAVWRIFHFHVPAFFTAATMGLIGFVASIMYLMKRNLQYDALAVSATEVLLTFGAVNLVTGMIWARPIWGVWWAWDARLTSMLIFWLMYAGYLLLRRSIDDPTARARTSAVLSVFMFPGVYIVWKSILWWRTQHPGPVLSIRNGGGMAEGFEAAMWWNALALITLGIVLLLIRMRQEQTRQQIDAMRQEVYAATAA